MAECVTWKTRMNFSCSALNFAEGATLSEMSAPHRRISFCATSVLMPWNGETVCAPP
jgi:hypothetical protein